jgi:hypothetical protein
MITRNQMKKCNCHGFSNIWECLSRNIALNGEYFYSGKIKNSEPFKLYKWNDEQVGSSFN